MAVMFLVYVDESGTPAGKKGRHYVLLGLGIPIDASASVRHLGINVLDNLRREHNYNQHELKGEKVFSTLKGKTDDYASLLAGVAQILKSYDAFTVAVVVDKKMFNIEVFPKLWKHLDAALARPPVTYLNALLVPSVRRGVIEALREKITDNVVRAQGLNELMLRVYKELETRDSIGIMTFDAEADNLVKSAYAMYATALADEGIAFGKEIVRPVLIKHIAISKSSLDFGIQLADLLANAVYNCLEHGVTEAYAALETSGLIGDKGFVVLPKGAAGCG